MGFAITPVNVKSGRVSLNGAIISVEDIQAEFKVERVEVTGTEDQQSGGNTPQNITSAIESMTASFTAVVDANKMPYGTFSLKQDADLTTVKFFLDKGVAARWCGASIAKVLSVTYMGRLKDAWKFRCNIESSGGYDCTITHPS